MAIAALHRGVIFRAEHDDSYPFWGDNEPPRSKLCLVFNADPVQEGDVHYFLATSKVDRYRESPSILSDVLILPPASYTSFSIDTTQRRRKSINVSRGKNG